MTHYRQYKKLELREKPEIIWSLVTEVQLISDKYIEKQKHNVEGHQLSFFFLKIVLNLHF